MPHERIRNWTITYTEPDAHAGVEGRPRTVDRTVTGTRAEAEGWWETHGNPEWDLLDIALTDQRPGEFSDGTPYGHIRITDAPAAYDGFGTRLIEALPFRGKFNGNQFRTVSIPEAAMFGNWQVDRYASGLYASLTAAQWAELQDLIAVPIP